MSRSRLLKAVVVVLVLTGSYAHAAMVSTMQNVGAVMEDQGFRIAPVSTMFVAGDQGQAQVFEIIRPYNDRITIGRLNTSCSCVQLETAKSTYERGERALVILRNIRPTPPNGQMYAFYVQITSPIHTTLRQDAFVQSDQFRRPAPQPTTVPAQYGYRNMRYSTRR